MAKKNEIEEHGDYIKYKGSWYEKLTTKTEPMDLDLDSDVHKQLKKMVRKEGFVNIQEAMRAAIREMIKQVDTK